MASLNSLPTELLEYVVVDLTHKDRINLARTCKALYTVALPAGYCSITLRWSNQPHTAQQTSLPLQGPKIQSLLRTLIGKPELIQQVKSLTFFAQQCLHSEPDGNVRIDIPSSGIVLRQEDIDIEMFRAHTVEMMYLPVAEWGVRLLEERKLNVIMAQVIGLCGNLEELTISVDFLLRNEWFSTLIEYGLNCMSSGQITPWFSKLERARVVIFHDKDGELWGPEFLRVQRTLLLLFYIPNLSSLEIAAFSDIDEDGRVVWVEEEIETDRPFWPLAIPPTASNLTTLRLVRSSLDSSTVEQVLMQTPHLRVFEFDCYKHPGHVPFFLSELNTALSHVRDTLVDLTVLYSLYNNEDADVIARDTFDTTRGSLGPLLSFPVLTRLETSLPVLFGEVLINGNGNPRLEEHLPPKLQELVVTDDLWMYGEFQQCFEDMAAMRIFREYLAGEVLRDEEMARASEVVRDGKGFFERPWDEIEWVTIGEPGWKVNTPELKEFTYDLREFGSESFDYWTLKKVRRELVRVCEEQGIKGTVLWGEVCI